jgi:hypothetical protein
MADKDDKKATPTPTPSPDSAKVTGQSRKGVTAGETNVRTKQAAAEGTMADKAAVQKGMQVDLGAAARRAAEKRMTPTPTPSPVAKKTPNSKSATSSR